MKIQSIAKISLLLLCAAAAPAQAEDIDLFLQSNEAATQVPNVLFMLDNSANWNATLFRLSGNAVTKKDVIHEALYKAIMDPNNTDKLSVGYSEFASHSGGKITAAVGRLTSGNQRTLARKIYKATPWTPAMVMPLNLYVLPSYHPDPAASRWNLHYYQVTTAGISGESEPTWPTNGTSVTTGSVTLKDMGLIYGATAIQAIQSYNNAPYALTMNEDYLYYRGDAPLYGTMDEDYDHTAVASGKYVSPNSAQVCEKNFIILIGSGAPDSGENTDAYNRLFQLYRDNGVTSAPVSIPLNPNNYQSNWGDEYAAFFNSVGDANKVESGKQPITVYVIDVYDTTANLTKPEQAARAFLKSIAQQGRGLYFSAGNASDLSAALTKILNEVLSVNSVFASTTLPVSINVRGTNLNQVYMGVFRPDPNKLPDWYGNLKMYKLGYDSATQNIFLADALGNRADSPVTGFVVSSAPSFWTHRTDSSVYSVASYPADTQWWWWSPRGTNSDPKSDYPDGDLVEKGAAAQWLREHPTVRKLYTCHTCTSGAALETFDASNVSAADLGVSATDAAGTMNFIIGNNSTLSDGPEQVRSMVHGDVLHSRPATINYGPTGDDVMVYYGANDGVFHAVKGGESASSWGHQVGEEVWGFIPPESFTNLPKLYYNAMIDSSHPKPYFVDGTIMTLNWSGHNYVYLTMRRGGRAIYALNVDDNHGNPPTVAWRKRNTELPELGQTWSDPHVYLVNVSGVQKPVIVMGAGYDTAEDIDVTDGTHDTMGRGVYVLDAITGAVIRYLGNTSQQAGSAANVLDAIPGGITSAGSIDVTTGIQTLTTAYAADTGGNVWKLFFTDPNPANWSMIKMATLGGTGADNRKFLFQTDVVNRTVGYTAVLIGSGDREHPYDATVGNYFFMLKDYYDGVLNSWPLTLTAIPNNTSYVGSEPGWKLPLTGSGEKVVGSAVTLNGVIFFNTNVPSGTTTTSLCTPSLGEARAYAVSLNNASPQTGTTLPYTVAPGGGYLPSPVPFTVDIGDITVSGTISGTQVAKPPQPNFGHITHQFWYKRGVDQ